MYIDIIVDTIDGKKRVIKTTYDVNGNPRYLIDFISLNLNNREHSEHTRKYFNKTRSKSYSDCFVFSSYNVQDTLNSYFKEIK